MSEDKSDYEFDFEDEKVDEGDGSKVNEKTESDSEKKTREEDEKSDHEKETKENESEDKKETKDEDDDSDIEKMLRDDDEKEKEKDFNSGSDGDRESEPTSPKKKVSTVSTSSMPPKGVSINAKPRPPKKIDPVTRDLMRKLESRDKTKRPTRISSSAFEVKRKTENIGEVRGSTAQGLTGREFDNKLAEKDKIIKNLREEIKSLENLQRRQTKAILEYDSSQNNLPVTMASVQDELRGVKEALKNTQNKIASNEKLMKHQHQQILKYKQRCEDMVEFLKQRGIGEEQLKEDTETLAKNQQEIADLRSRNDELEHMIDLQKKRREQEDKKAEQKKKELQAEIDSLKDQIADLKKRQQAVIPASHIKSPSVIKKEDNDIEYTIPSTTPSPPIAKINSKPVPTLTSPQKEENNNTTKGNNNTNTKKTGNNSLTKGKTDDTDGKKAVKENNGVVLNGKDSKATAGGKEQDNKTNNPATSKVNSGKGNANQSGAEDSPVKGKGSKTTTQPVAKSKARKPEIDLEEDIIPEEEDESPPIQNNTNTRPGRKTILLEPSPSPATIATTTPNSIVSNNDKPSWLKSNTDTQPANNASSEPYKPSFGPPGLARRNKTDWKTNIVGSVASN